MANKNNTFDVRVLDRIEGETQCYYVQIFMKTNTGKKGRRAQFYCNYKLSQGELIPCKRKTDRCFKANSIWNSDNYQNIGKAVVTWFFNDVKIHNAFQTTDDAVFWHLKKISKEESRYTLYECCLSFVSKNIEHYGKVYEARTP